MSYQRQLILRIVLLETVIVAAAALLGALLHADAERYFREGRIVTWVSVAQLWLVAWLAWTLYKARRAVLPATGWRSPALLWAVVAAGFVFLGIDEGATIHESLDKWAHDRLGVTPGPISDRFDDLIVALYGLAGLGVLYAYRGELAILGPRSALIRYGFYCLALTVEMDLLGNKPHVLFVLIGDWNVVFWFRPLVGVVEEWLKLIGEGLFVAVFHLQLREMGGRGVRTED